MSRARIAVAALSVTAATMVGLWMDEGWFERASIPVKGDVPTVGPGLTKRPDGSPVRMGDTITPIEGARRSLAHIQNDERGIKACVTAELHQVEYDLMVKFSYQYGVPTLCKSDIVREANAGNYVASCNAYLDFKYITSGREIKGWEPYKFDKNGKPTRWRFDCSTPGNKVCRGVWTRQLDRHAACMAAQ